jgi:hypothetical protein
LLKKRNNDENVQNFKSSDQSKEDEEIIAIANNKTVSNNVPNPKNELFEYFTNLKEITSSNKTKTNFEVKIIKTDSTRFDTTNKNFRLQLYGLEGKSKEKKITPISNKYEFDFKSSFIGQIIGLSLRWIQTNDNSHFLDDIETIKSIEIYDKDNNVNTKYLHNKYWFKENTNDEFSNLLLISNKSIDEILEYKKSIDFLNSNEEYIFEQSEIKTLEYFLNHDQNNYIYLTFTKDLRAKINRLILNNLENEIKLKNFNDETNLISIFNIILGFTIVSDDFSNFLYENNSHGIEILFHLLDLFIAEENYTTKRLRYLMKVFHNLARICSHSIQVWRGKLEIFKKLSQKFYAFKLRGPREDCFAVISFIATDDEMKKISEEKNTDLIKIFVDKIEYLSNQIVNKTCTRSTIKINEKIVEVAVYNCVFLVAYMDILFAFAKSDSIKYILYSNFKMNDILRKIIYHGNKAEQESAFKLLYQLCFDEKIAKDILDDEQLLNLIQSLTRSNDCKGILFVIENKFNKQENNLINLKNKHVMISYNSKSRDYCLEIKKELENIGKIVWIDIESIAGSSLGKYIEYLNDWLDSSLVLFYPKKRCLSVYK